MDDKKFYCCNIWQVICRTLIRYSERNRQKNHHSCIDLFVLKKWNWGHWVLCKFCEHSLQQKSNVYTDCPIQRGENYQHYTRKHTTLVGQVQKPTLTDVWPFGFLLEFLNKRVQHSSVKNLLHENDFTHCS